MMTIGITTFKHRYEKYFIPLLNTIKTINPDIEVIVAINGEYKEQFDNNYRKEILSFIATKDNTYSIMYPEFRGLSKLWNEILIHSSNEYVLMLNDDVTIDANNFIDIVTSNIEQYQTSFKLNGSWSHVVLKKSEIEDVGFFSEKLLGIGEEDGFFEWIYQYKLNKPFGMVYIPGIINHVDMSHNPTNTKVITQGKYSLFNQETMYKNIFRIDNIHGVQMGVCPAKLMLNNEFKEQYPYEKFYRDNKNNL